MSVSPLESGLSRRNLAALVVLCALAFGLCAPAGAGAAEGDPVFDRAFGAGPADLCSSSCTTGSQGGAAGQLSLPSAVAVSGGEVFVADTSNHRVGVFTTDGVFVRAFGKGVEAGGANAD